MLHAGEMNERARPVTALSRDGAMPALLFNENVTRKNKKLFWFAIRRPKEKLFRFVWVDNSKTLAFIKSQLSFLESRNDVCGYLYVLSKFDIECTIESPAREEFLAGNLVFYAFIILTFDYQTHFLGYFRHPPI